MKEARRLMEEGVARGVFPGGVLHVRRNRRDLFHEAYGQADLFSRQPMTRDTVFDLASLTKPLATAPAVLKLADEGRLRLDDAVGDILPEFRGTDKHAITPVQLLLHTSGLPAHREYFLTLARLPRQERDQALLRLLAGEPLEYAPGRHQVYSDLGYMVLKYVVEKVSGKRLDVFVHEFLYAPLRIHDLFFIDIHREDPAALEVMRTERAFAATEDCPRRGCLVKGMVHDDNAYEAGGVAGQAGLFGTTTAVARFLDALLDIHGGETPVGILSRETTALMLAPKPGSGRTYGFDTPDRENSSAGRLFSDTTVGHLGFTGVSVWLDIARAVTVLLFTNRVHPRRDHNELKAFRPILHDAVMSELTGQNPAVF
ncbi:MAG: serine hydrolase domain-containing protein [Thermodesulfobacteriota bacterium]